MSGTSDSMTSMDSESGVEGLFLKKGCKCRLCGASVSRLSAHKAADPFKCQILTQHKILTSNP